MSLKINEQFFIPLVITFSLLAVSCENFSEVPVNIKTPAHAPALAVTADFYVPDTMLTVFLTHSQGLLESEQSKIDITDAQVQLFKGGDILFDFPHRDDLVATGNYPQGSYAMSIPKPIEYDLTDYTLKVSAPNFDVAESTVQLLDTVSIEGGSFAKNGYIDLEGNQSSEITFNFTDPTGIKNYYGIRIYIERNGRILSSAVPLHPISSTVEYGAEELLFSDVNHDGKEIMLRLHSYNLSFFSGPPPDYIILRLYSISEEKYLYSRATYANDNLESNPLYEPISVPSNIKGGYGIFAFSAYSEYRIQY